MASCKGKNKEGAPCGMRPAAGDDLCMRHKGGGAGVDDSSTTTTTKDKGGDDDSGALLGLGIALGIAALGGVLYFFFGRQQSDAPVRQLRRVA